ncbi:MAG: alpha/beta hydrolase [Candidatus Obscuribacterales bacterium]|nr:alpha/beta hydrolase [Steroidobacteraceae bacterium]
MHYAPVRYAENGTLELRDLKFHIHRWPGTDSQLIVLLHGWGDTGETFQFLVDHFTHRYNLLAIDQRGFGRSEWPQDGYYFPDYLGDIDALLKHVSPDSSVVLIGHSMGGNIANMYAGIRPERVHAVVNLEGFGLSQSEPQQAPERYRQWLDELQARDKFPTYATYDALTDSLQRRHKHLPRDRADFIARAWGVENNEGRIALRADPRHRRVNPMLYRRDESRICWGAMTAPLLFIAAEESEHYARVREQLVPFALQRDFRNAELKLVSQAGHMLHLEQPEAVAGLITEFLNNNNR